ncbi:hypothetical protein AAY80_137 [Stenotrophomonas phage vB_SmaS-DLP_6]|nr:hypothetical protein AAY80_137 [Stenotrophomonas phage vB_SmaS-DLP_6]
MPKQKVFDPSKRDGIQYNVYVPGYSENKKSTHDVMSREEWLDGVESHFFIDYDGYGDGIKADGKFVQRLRPSIADKILPGVDFIVWFNK